MRRSAQLVLILGLVASFSGMARAGGERSAGRFGAGLQVGYPGNGLSFNYFLSDSASLQVGAPLWLEGDWRGAAARVDLLWWQAPLARPEFAEVSWYFGPGGYIVSFDWKGKSSEDSNIGLGAEFPVGVGFFFTKVPLDLNVEFVPLLQLHGPGDSPMDFAIAGVVNSRYYF
jgi:hypothetical protein